MIYRSTAVSHSSVITITSIIYCRRRYINELHKFQFYANPKLTVTVINPKLALTNPKR